MNNDPPPIAIDGLKVRRGDKLVLADLSVTVRRGTVTGLLGPSGCGKTTLMRAVVGVQRLVAGSVRVLGEPAGSPSLRRRVAYVTQQPSVYGDLTAEQNLAFYARILGSSQDDVARAIAAVDLEAHASQLTARLSGGQRTRVSVAAALLGDPELLVLDEPTVGLDPLLREELWSTFRGLAAAGRTLLISSHVMDEADRCEDLLLMREGRILAHESPAALRRRTGARSVGEAFLGLVREAQAA